MLKFEKNQKILQLIKSRCGTRPRRQFDIEMGQLLPKQTIETRFYHAGLQQIIMDILKTNLQTRAAICAMLFPRSFIEIILLS